MLRYWCFITAVGFWLTVMFAINQFPDTTDSKKRSAGGAEIAVYSTPHRAVVYLNWTPELYLTLEPNTNPVFFEIEPGVHEITISKPGYHPVKRLIKIKPNQKAILEGIYLKQVHKEELITFQVKGE